MLRDAHPREEGEGAGQLKADFTSGLKRTTSA